MDTELVTTSGGTFSAIDRAPLAPSTRAKYRRALERYLETGHSLADSQALAAYAATLSTSARSFLKAAVRLVTGELAGTLKGEATPGNLAEVQASLLRLEAIQAAVKVKASEGSKAHLWLSQAQVRRLFDACQNGILGQRDRLVLGLLVAAGLRREEVCGLRFEDVKLQPVGERFRTVLEVKGKGGKVRVVPVSDGLARALAEWGALVGGRGYVARSLGVNREPGRRLSGQGVFDIVQKRGAMIGTPDLQPHDLRRTYAQLGHEAGVPLVQISRLLGHANVQTTMRYLNLDVDLQTTISDFIPF